REPALRGAMLGASGGIHERVLWEVKDKRSSAACLTLDCNPPAMGFHYALADAEAQAVPTRAFRTGAVHAEERLKDALDVTLGNSDAVIRDTDHYRVRVLGH